MVVNLGTISSPYSYSSQTYSYNVGGYTILSTTPLPQYETTTTTAPAPTGSVPTPSTPAPPEAISTITGIDPAEVAAATYGKVIAIWVGGMPMIGGHIIFGPYFTSIGGIIYTSFGVSFGMPAWNNPAPGLTGSRELRELRLDGYKVWSLSEGYLLSGLTFRFYGGTETQAADPLVIAAYPSAPVAHKGQCCVFIENLALTDFAGKVPFVSALIADTTFGEPPEDGLTYGQMISLLAGSRYLGFDINLGGDFSTEGLNGRLDGLIVAEKVGFLELLNRFARLHLWDVVQTDQLKVLERGTVDPEISLDLTHILSTSDAPPILIERAQQSDIPRELDYSYIDPDRDYEINTVTASRPRSPAPATVSAGKDTIALPAVHTVQEATSLVTLRRMKDELSRETVSFTTDMFGYGIEPGDIVAVDAGFKIYILRVLETLKGANWTNRIKAEPILRCAPPGTTVGTTWNPIDKNSNVSLSGSDLIATLAGNGSQWNIVRATNPRSSGAYYVEFTIDAMPSPSATLPIGLGLANSAQSIADGAFLGNSNSSFGDYVNDGSLVYNTTVHTVLSTATVGQVIGFGVDFDSRSAHFINATTGETGRVSGGDLTLGNLDMALMIAASLRNIGAKVTANFGAGSFVGDVPTGFASGWDATTPTGYACEWVPIRSSSNFTISGGASNIATKSAGGSFWWRAQASIHRDTGKYYAEFVIDATGTASGANGDWAVGICSPVATLRDFLGDTGDGVATLSSFSVGYYPNNGVVIIAGSTAATIQTGVAGNTICVAVDFDNRTIWFRTNAGNWNNNGSANPATNTGGISFSALSSSHKYAASFSGFGVGPATTADFAAPFAQTVPSGFAAWS